MSTPQDMSTVSDHGTHWYMNPDRRSAVLLGGTGAYWGGLALTGLNPAVLRKGVTSGALCVPPPGVIRLPNLVQARWKV